MLEKMRRVLAALMMLALLMGSVPVSAQELAGEQEMQLVMEQDFVDSAAPEAEMDAEEVQEEIPADASPEPTVEPAVAPEDAPAADSDAGAAAESTAEPEMDAAPEEMETLQLSELAIVALAAAEPEEGQDEAESGIPIEEIPEEIIETPASSFKYTIKDGKCTITGFKGKEKEIVIPALIQDAPVTAIAAKAFYKCSKITSIHIQGGVASIGSYAFRNCTALKKVIVPASVAGIASDAFKGCKKYTLVVDENSWAHNWCMQRGVAYAFSGNVIDAPTYISVNANEITLGVKEKFSLACVDDMGNAEGFTFKSSNAKVASVSKDGVITAKKAGKATITVRTANYVKAECRVVVKKAPSKITLNQKNITLYLGQSADLSWKLSSKSAGTVSFSSDSDCVCVDANGVITALSLGEAKITAKTYNGKKAACTVKVIDVPSFVSLPENHISLPMLMSAQLQPVIDEGAGTTFSYASSDEAIATVDENGLVTGVNAGFAVITVSTHNGHTADIVAEVTLAPTRIFMEEQLSLGVKEKFTLKPVDDLQGTEGFTFKTSSSKIASISQDGVITAKKAGKATITVSTFNGAKAECQVVVKNAPKSIKLTQSKITMLTGQTHQLAWKLSSKSAGRVSFSSNSDCITVDENGLITAHAEGTAKITAKTFNGKKAACTVTVKSSKYAITSMRVDDRFIYATVSTAGVCTLHAEVWSEDGKKALYKASAPAGEGLDLQEIAAAGMDAYPEYYLLRAILKNDKGEELCNPFISKRYTSAYVEFEQQTPEDFAEDRVLDFGDAGYGVLADGVKNISGDALVSGDEYTFTTDQEIHAGDVLLLNGEPIKVAEVVAGGGGGGGHTRIRRDRNVNVQEVYKSVRVDGYVDLGEAFHHGSAAELHEAGNDEAIVEILKIKKDFEITKNIIVTPEIGGTARIRLVYDEINFGKDYFETEFYVEAGGKVDVFIGAAGAKEKNIELIDVPLPIGLTGLSFDIELNVPMKLDAKVGGTATYNFSMKKGVAYTPDMGKQEINSEAKPTADFKLAGEFTASIGIGVSGGLTFLDDCLRAAINGEVGLQAKGEWALLNSADSMNEAKTAIHACQQCVEITASVYGEFYVNLNSRINKEGKDKEVARFTIVRAEIPVLEFYASVKNEAISVHQGQLAFGVGDCPNNKYRCTVYTVDEYLEDIYGISITVSRPGMATLGGSSTWQDYLYPGQYLVSGDFDGYPVTDSFTVKDRPGGTTLNAPACSLSGYVTDAYTKEGISGASVSIALPENKTITVQTDADGFYNFKNLKAGECSVFASAKGYQDRYVDGLKFAPNTVNSCNIEMLGPMPVLTASLNGGGTVQALPEDGVYVEGLPKIIITNTVDKYWKYNVEDVVVSYDGCEYRMDGGAAWGGSEVSCFDMGDGKYTIILKCWVNGTMGGSETVVLQMRNGKLTPIKEFTLNNRSDKIYVDAKFTTDTKFSGTIYPSKIKFTANAHKVTWKENRKGKKVYGKNAGNLNYKKNDEGYYDLIYTTFEICLANMDYVGSSYTLYQMRNGELKMIKQWYEGAAD